MGASPMFHGSNSSMRLIGCSAMRSLDAAG
jgi:hypothetical protein